MKENVSTYYKVVMEEKYRTFVKIRKVNKMKTETKKWKYKYFPNVKWQKNYGIFKKKNYDISKKVKGNKNIKKRKKMQEKRNEI